MMKIWMGRAILTLLLVGWLQCETMGTLAAFTTIAKVSNQINRRSAFSAIQSLMGRTKEFSYHVGLSESFMVAKGHYLHRMHGIHSIRRMNDGQSSDSCEITTTTSCHVISDALQNVPTEQIVRLRIPTADEMEGVGAILAEECARGDVLLLGGDLGAGKTCFSRGFIKCLTGDPTLRVTSPTYLLSNTYPIVLLGDEADDEQLESLNYEE